MDLSAATSVTDFLVDAIARYGYFLVFLLVFLETAALAGFFVPGETALILAGAAASQGLLELRILIPGVVLAAVLGDGVGYLIGRRMGRDFLLRHQRVFRVTPEHLERVDRFFARHGGKTVIIGRHIGFLRVLSPLVAGASRMPYWRFFTYNLVGAILWAVTDIGLGYLFGRSYQLVEKWLGRVSLVLLVLLVLGVALWYFGKRVLWPRREELGSALGSYANAVLEWGPVRWTRRRFAPQLEWVGRRLSPGEVFGLFLTLGLILSALLFWLFAKLLQDVLARDPLTLFDETVAVTLSEHAVPWLTAVMKVVTYLGSAWVIIPATCVICVLLLWRGWRPDALLLATSTLGAFLLVNLVKVIVRRPRPDLVEPLVSAAGYSFPSAHAAVSMAFYGTLGLLAAGWVKRWEDRVYVLLAALGVIALVGFSRLYLGVHYLSDVLAGYALGALWTTICVTAWTVWQRARGG